MKSTEVQTLPMLASGA